MNNDACVADLRKLFPVVKHWTYLYNGSVHPCPLPVGNAMRSFLTQWEQGGHAAWPPAKEAFGKLKEQFARLIHAKAGNIVVTESTTAAINLAARILGPQPGRNVVVSDLDFMSDTYPWLVSHAGVEVRFVESRNGKIYMEDLERLVDERTAVLTISAVMFGSGFRINLADVHAIARKRHVPLLVDAAQALGLIDVNVLDPELDFLVCTAGKWLMGPTGIGFLYVGKRFIKSAPPAAGWLAAANRNEMDARHCRLHPDAMRFQGGMPNLIGVVGALAALELLEQIGRDFIERRVRALTSHALEGLRKIGADIWTPRPDHERAGIVFFRVPRHQELYAQLQKARVYCGCFLGGIRIDPNFYNTFEEIDKFLAVVRAHAVGNKKAAQR